MNRHLTEEEQLETLKEWWREYGKITVAAVVVALIGSFGWRYWQSHRIRVRSDASIIYERLLTADTNKKPQDVKKYADGLIEKYTHTAYAKFAELISAKQAVEQGQLNVAKKKLFWVVENADNLTLRQLAKLRVSRVLLEQKQYTQALRALKTLDDQTYRGVVDEVKGDIYIAMGKTPLAHKMYQSALNNLPEDSDQRNIVKMKLGT